MRLLAVLAMFTTVLARPPEARAGACCVSASAVGVGRLLLWEQSAVGVRTSVGSRIGEWSTDGQWRADGSDYDALEWRSELWGHIRIVNQFSAVVRLPVLLTNTHANDLDVTGGGLSDLSVGLRYEPVLPGQYAGVPGIALFLGTTIPTGRAMHDADEPADVTSRGGWALTTGLSLERVILPWFIRADVSVVVPLAHTAEANMSKRFGVGVTTSLISGWEVVPSVVLSVLGQVAWEDDLHRNDVAVAGSNRLQPTVGLALSWRFLDHWTAQASVNTGIFADTIGINQVGQVTTTLGLRYGIFE